MRYAFRAVDKNGATIAGEREAGSERELSDSLRHENLLLLEGRPSSLLTRHRLKIDLKFPNPFRRVTLVERMVFARNLAVMVGAGLAMTGALEALAEQSQNQRFREIIDTVREAVVSGKTFAEGLMPYQHIFGPLFIHMVQAGELSGKLEQVLKLLARQMKRDHDLRAKVRGAMLYPAIVVGALVVVGTVMMVYVVPVLTKTFTELEIQLPLSTRVIIGVSNFLVSYFFYALIGAVLSGFGAFRVAKSAVGKRLFDTLVLRVPIFGPLIRKLNSARFARTLSSLLSAGISITQALKVTALVLGNSQFKNSLASAAEAIERGRPLNETLHDRQDLFPPMVTQMVRVGEETGTIAPMLLRIALFYEEEVTETTKNLSSIIEPVLMIVIGGVVGFFAVSMIQPIYGGLGNL